MNRVTINIKGFDYKLVTESSVEHMRDLESRLNAKVDSLCAKADVSLQDALILIALNLMDADNMDGMQISQMRDEISNLKVHCSRLENLMAEFGIDVDSGENTSYDTDIEPTGDDTIGVEEKTIEQVREELLEEVVEELLPESLDDDIAVDDLLDIAINDDDENERIVQDTLNEILDSIMGDEKGISADEECLETEKCEVNIDDIEKKLSSEILPSDINTSMDIDILDDATKDDVLESVLSDEDLELKFAEDTLNDILNKINSVTDNDEVSVEPNTPSDQEIEDISTSSATNFDIEEVFNLIGDMEESADINIVCDISEDHTSVGDNILESDESSGNLEEKSEDVLNNIISEINSNTEDEGTVGLNTTSVELIEDVPSHTEDGEVDTAVKSDEDYSSVNIRRFDPENSFKEDMKMQNSDECMREIAMILKKANEETEQIRKEVNGIRQRFLY